MEISKKILDKYELLQHEFLRDTGCDSVLLRHKKTGARIALIPSEMFEKKMHQAMEYAALKPEK